MKKIKNYLTNEYVLIAPERMNRPHDFKSEILNIKSSKDTCPFCQSDIDNAHDILYKNKSESCIIIKNKFPAVDGIDSSHEVVIDSREHEICFSKLELFDMVEVIKAIVVRETTLFKDDKIATVQVYKNSGGSAGASLQHSHMQIVALDFVPFKLKTISKNMSKYKKEHNKCYICDLKEDKDIFTFYENETFKATSKYDTTMSQTIDLFPKRHIRNFGDMLESDIYGLCDAIKVSIDTMNKVMDNLSYNIAFFTPPRVNGVFNDDFHFYVQIIPRMFGFAGFEVATGCFINSVDSVEYVKKLRKAYNS